MNSYYIHLIADRHRLSYYAYYRPASLFGSSGGKDIESLGPEEYVR